MAVVPRRRSQHLPSLVLPPASATTQHHEVTTRQVVSSRQKDLLSQLLQSNTVDEKKACKYEVVLAADGVDQHPQLSHVVDCFFSRPGQQRHEQTDEKERDARGSHQKLRR